MLQLDFVIAVELDRSVASDLVQRRLKRRETRKSVAAQVDHMGVRTVGIKWVMTSDPFCGLNTKLS
jgi:hypothetical protein